MVIILVARSRRFKSSASAKKKTAAVKADQKQDGALESDVQHIPCHNEERDCRTIAFGYFLCSVGRQVPRQVRCLWLDAEYHHMRSWRLKNLTFLGIYTRRIIYIDGRSSEMACLYTYLGGTYVLKYGARTYQPVTIYQTFTYLPTKYLPRYLPTQTVKLTLGSFQFRTVRIRSSKRVGTRSTVGARLRVDMNADTLGRYSPDIFNLQIVRKQKVSFVPSPTHQDSAFVRQHKRRRSRIDRVGTYICY